MVAPIMNVGNLRNCNVLMHLNIGHKRDRIPDIPCVYLVEPTEENFKHIADDGCRNLYDYFLITFTKPISPQGMEKFASHMLKTNQAHKVLRVSQEYLGAFQVISPDFFVLPGGEANFKTLSYKPGEEVNSARVIISKAVDHIANGLFCLFQSLGVPPPILRLKENDQLGTKISRKLAELYKKFH